MVFGGLSPEVGAFIQARPGPVLRRANMGEDVWGNERRGNREHHPVPLSLFEPGVFALSETGRAGGAAPPFRHAV